MLQKFSSWPARWSTLWSNRFALLLFLLLSACGYQLTAQSVISLPEDSTHLFLHKVVNPSTETWLDLMVRTSLRDEFTRRGNVQWVDQDEAQAIVNVNIQSYGNSASVTGRDDVTVKSLASIVLEVTFYNAKTNVIIWTSGPITATESYRGTSGERNAAQGAVDRAFRMVADRLSQNF